MNFAMFKEECELGTRYVYRLVDRERGQKFEVAFIIAHDAFAFSYIDPRPWEDARCMFKLWEGLKRNSPGTFLEARNRGWIAATDDRGPAT